MAILGSLSALEFELVESIRLGPRRQTNAAHRRTNHPTPPKILQIQPTASTVVVFEHFGLKR